MPEPITLSEAKLYMRIDEDYTYDDAVISDMITGNREWMEKQLNLSLIPKTGLTQKYNRGCHCCEPPRLYINYGPVTANLTVTTTGLNPTDLVLDSTYWNIGDDEFPILYAHQNAKVTYDAGYTTETIPVQLKSVLKMLVATNYEQRENYRAEDSTQAMRMMFPFSRNLVL